MQKGTYFARNIKNGVLPRSGGGAHITVVVGAPHAFESVHSAYVLAVKLGFNGSQLAFSRRLKAGADWKKAIAPVCNYRLHNPGLIDQANKNRKRARDEMHDICVELDRRKAEIANG